MNTEEFLTYDKVLTKHYGFEVTTGITTLIKAGVENTNLILKQGNNPFVFRIYNLNHSIRGKRTKQSIELELDFAETAKGQGIPTPQVIRNNSGERITTFQLDGQQRYAVMFPFVSGSSPKTYTSDRTQEVGKTVNALFAVGESFKEIDIQQDFNILSRSLEIYAEIEKINKGLPETISSTLEQLHQRLQEQLEHIDLDKLTRGLVHGDLKLENLLFDDKDKVTAVLDFDDYRYSYLVEEATMALMHNLHSRTENVIRSGNYKAFIGELSNSSLVLELQHLPTFMLARLLYDLCKNVKKDKMSLIPEILQDSFVQVIILQEKF